VFICDLLFERAHDRGWNVTLTKTLHGVKNFLQDFLPGLQLSLTHSTISGCSDDQPASCELNTRGQPICKRLGAAVDFIVTDESMLEVAQWIVQYTPFDRLYFYGDDKPVHVSCGPDDKREVVIMKASKSDRSIPRVIKVETFLVL